MKKFLGSLLAIGILFFSAMQVYAVMKTYTATAEDYASEVESQEVAKQRAKEKAIRKAREQAGVYLKSYVKVENLTVTDEEISAVTNNTYKMAGEPTFSKAIQQLSDETSVIVWKATVNVNIDDEELKKFVKRDSEEKTKIVEETDAIQEVFDDNNAAIEELREQYKNASSDAERRNIKSDIETIEKVFITNQKLNEVNRLRYENNLNGAIKILNEIVEINPNHSNAYLELGKIYFELDDYNKAVSAFSAAIDIAPYYFDAYYNRGVVYYSLGDYKKAIADFTKCIEIFPENAEGYKMRGDCYHEIGQIGKATADYEKAEGLEYTE